VLPTSRRVGPVQKFSVRAVLTFLQVHVFDFPFLSLMQIIHHLKWRPSAFVPLPAGDVGDRDDHNKQKISIFPFLLKHVLLLLHAS
jgi:hypothetical protein